jgi:hypothetical protein
LIGGWMGAKFARDVGIGIVGVQRLPQRELLRTERRVPGPARAIKIRKENCFELPRIGVSVRFVPDSDEKS